MTVSVVEKKRFLTWLVTHETFVKREVSWVLNYLIQHEAILANVHLVEHASAANRGILIQTKEYSGEALMLFLEGKAFDDSDQIFHEIRFNWQKPLYLECLFPNAWNNDLYLAVLEDNPFFSWNAHVDANTMKQMDQYFYFEEIERNLQLLYQEIDTALESGIQEEFIELTKKINELEKEKASLTKR